MDDGTFGALLKTLSDSSEEVRELDLFSLFDHNLKIGFAGHQTRLGTTCSDLITIRRGLLQDIYDQSIGSFQHRPKSTRRAWKFDYQTTVFASQHRSNIQGFRRNLGKGRGPFLSSVLRQFTIYQQNKRAIPLGPGICQQDDRKVEHDSDYVS